MRRSARTATSVVITSAFGLVVAATSTPGGHPTVLAAGRPVLLADHDDGSGGGSGSSGSGSSGSGSSGSGSSGSGSSGSGAALDLGGALAGSHSSGSGTGGSHSSGTHPSDTGTTGSHPSSSSSGSQTSGSHDLGRVHLPAVELPVRTPAVQLPEVQTPEVQLPKVQTPAVSVPSASVPSVSVPSVSVPPMALPAIPLAPVAVPNVPLPVLAPTVPLASSAPLLAPSDVFAGVLDAPTLASVHPLFGPPTGDQGVLRVAHLSPSTGAVDMYVEGPGLPRTKVASDVTYRTLSTYLAATPGIYTLEARPAGAAPTTPPALTASVAVAPHSAQTAAFVDVGPDSTPQAEVLSDGTSPAPPGRAFVRVVSAAAGVGPMDVVARGGGPLAQNLFYGSGSSYTEVDARTWTMDVRTTNGETAVATVPVPSTAVATVVVGRDARGALTATAVPDAASAFAGATPAPAGPGTPAPAPASPAPAPAPASPAPTPSTTPTPPTSSTPAPPPIAPTPAPRNERLPRGGVPAGFGGLADLESRLVPVQVRAAPAPFSPAVPALAPTSGPGTSTLDAAPGPALVPLTPRAAAPALVPVTPRPAPAAPALVPLTARPAPAAAAPAAVATGARPAGLVVPAAGIDAPDVGTLGLDEHGELQAPATPNDVGWYRDGASPGDPGTAVLVGHVDSWRGPGVFWHLRDLRPGDAIDVPRGDGTVAHFAVDAVETVPKDAFPSEKVYAPTAGPSLRLITCGGPFDRSVRSYEDNVVVYASAR